MSIILSFLTFLEIVAAILIIVVILMQRSKSGGGLGALSGGATEEVFGSSAGNVLSRTTVVLSLFFLVNTLLIVMLQGNITRSRNVSVIDSVGDTGVSIIESPSDSEIEENAASAAPSKDDDEVTDSSAKPDVVGETSVTESEPSSSQAEKSPSAVTETDSGADKEKSIPVDQLSKDAANQGENVHPEQPENTESTDKK